MREKRREVWRDIAAMNPLESDNKLVTYHSSPGVCSALARWCLCS